MCCFNQDNKLFSTLFVLKTFSTKEISSIIKLLKTKNTHGYDEISTRILKISSNYITSPLTCICNRISLFSSFPDCLKYSIIKPVFKRGDRTNYTNYRPISLLTSFSKIFEKAIYIRLTEYLLNNKILSDSQYGFRKGLATENAIFRLVNEILNSQNSKTKIGSVFCDLQKTFDTVKSWFTTGQAAMLWNKRESYKIDRILPSEKIPESKLLHKAQVIRHYQTG